MLVVAGAGTGKTTVLTERISHLIEHQHALPDQILAVTFTRNAAEELRTRVAARIGPFAAQQIIASTFHSYCAAVLEAAGRGFEPLSREDLWIFLRQRIQELELEHFIKPSDLGEFLRDLIRFFDRCNDENVDAAAYQVYVDRVSRGERPVPPVGRKFADLPPEQRLERLLEIAKVYRKVEQMLAAERLGTYGLQITHALALLQERPALLEECRGRARFILVDEFQDCNATQIRLIHLLGGNKANVFVVGDPDQAIYRFRGASSAAFDQFRDVFPHTSGVVLQENQRSRGPILDCSFELIRENPAVNVLVGNGKSYGRAPLVSARDEAERARGQVPPGTPVEVVPWTAAEQEAADIAERIRELNRQYGDDPAMREHSGAKPWFGVLYRLHGHRGHLIAELAQRGVPYIVKGVDVQDTGDVRDLLALLWAIDSPGDSGSLFRVASFTIFAIRPEELRRRLASAGEMSFTGILSSFSQGQAVLTAIDKARAFSRDRVISAVVSWCVEQFHFDRSSAAVIAFRNFIEAWKDKPLSRRKDLREFLAYMEYFEEAGGYIPLRSEEEQEKLERGDRTSVRLMTVHSAKGLEFRHVFVVRTTSGSFPLRYGPPLLDFPEELLSFPAPADSRSAHDQEERRMFYVAMTRARDTLALYGKQGIGRDKTPPGLLRPLLGALRGLPVIKSRDARPYTIDIQASAAPASAIGQWLMLPPRPKDAVVLSAHSVETYHECPLRYKLDRDWAIPGEPTAAVQFGNAVHKVLKDYYDPHARITMTVDQVVEAFRAEWTKVRADDPEQHALYGRRGVAQLRELVARYPRGSSKVLATEQTFRFKLGNLEIGGRMDRIDAVVGRRVRIVDYKTGNPRRQDHADKSLQLSIYAMAAGQLGHAVDSIAFVNVQNGEEVVTNRDTKALAHAREQIEEAADGIARGEFDPRTGFHCRWCAYRTLCPATEEKLITLGAASATGVN